MDDSEVLSHRLEGTIAIVTGASRGIGLAIAKRFVAEGASVCITARKSDALDAAAQDFPDGTVLAITGRTDDPVHRGKVLDAVAERYGRVDTLVNVAGMNPVFGTLMDLSLDSARRIHEVNVLAALAWTQELYRHPTLGFADRGGSVINLSSVTGQTPSPGLGFYGVSKAAIAHLTRTLAVELGPRIRVNAVAPAVVKTEFSKALYDGREAEVAAAYPLARLGTSEDVASAVAFLASRDSSWITGQVLTLDGGLITAGGTA